MKAVHFKRKLRHRKIFELEQIAPDFEGHEGRSGSEFDGHCKEKTLDGPLVCRFKKITGDREIKWLSNKPPYEVSESKCHDKKRLDCCLWENYARR